LMPLWVRKFSGAFCTLPELMLSAFTQTPCWFDHSHPDQWPPACKPLGKPSLLCRLSSEKQLSALPHLGSVSSFNYIYVRIFGCSNILDER
jgi:hypothetical protein